MIRMNIKSITLFVLVFLQANVYASESDIYDFSWLDPDKEVYVLQNRKFRKVSRFNLAIMGGKTTSGAFVDSTVVQARVGYFFKEEFGIELLYSKNDGEENSTAASVRNESGLTGSTPFRHITESYVGGMFKWAPFYSKINTFNKIIYLDIMFGLGVAQLTENNNRREFVDQTDRVETQETHTGLLWGTTLNFFLTENWGVRTDLTVIHYKAQEANGSSTKEVLYDNFDLTLGLNYNF